MFIFKAFVKVVVTPLFLPEREKKMKGTCTETGCSITLDVGGDPLGYKIWTAWHV